MSPPRIPWPTMFASASTRVRLRLMTVSRKVAKFRQPAQPASRTVVTPERKV